LKVVVDTNVLVSALLRPERIPARILDLVLSRQVTSALDHRVFNEYQEFLLRSEFGFPREAVIDLLDFLWLSSERVHVTPMSIDVPDADDVKFLEVAINAAADALVTGNLRHFPLRQRHGVQVLSPRQLWEQWSAMR
jgi:putative PIN family toxin of toxin-antitoxin system